MNHKGHSLINPAARHIVRLAGLTRETPDDLRERLLAYGHIPGETVRALAQRLVTVLQIEHTELALEKSLVSRVKVDAPASER